MCGTELPLCEIAFLKYYHLPGTVIGLHPKYCHEHKNNNVSFGVAGELKRRLSLELSSEGSHLLQKGHTTLIYKDKKNDIFHCHYATKGCCPSL